LKVSRAASSIYHSKRGRFMIRDMLSRHGRALFRCRSYIPLILLIPGVLILHSSPAISEFYGESIEEYWLGFCLMVSSSGLLMRALTVGFIPTGTSGRNTKRFRADNLNTTGMYSVCRNPLYFGNFLAIFGLVLAFQNIWFAMLSVLSYCLYIERVIAAEEDYLFEKYGQEYREWAEQTPLIVPNPLLWRKADLNFSFKTVLKREYSGVFALSVAFFSFELATDVFLEQEPVGTWLYRDWQWVALLIVGVFTYVVLRALKKFTRILKVEGR
jgi:protein-S-isoprenylcysteine O-methyltransferase Ste14